MKLITNKIIALQLALLVAGLFLISCSSDSTPAPTPTPPALTASDHIMGTFSISSATQAGQAIQTYSSTKVAIAKGSPLTFTVTSPPTQSALPATTSTASFDGTSKLTVGTIVMTLSNITAQGFKASFTRTAAANARGITGDWVFTFTKDS